MTDDDTWDVGWEEAAREYHAARKRGEPSLADDSNGNGVDDAAEIEKLARMKPLVYERARKDAGKKLGISRLSMLDALVKAKRVKLGLSSKDNGQGKSLEFPETKPHPEPVDAAALLEDIAVAIRRYVVMSNHAKDLCALWVVHTYVIERFPISPKLSVKSPTRQCGKTTLLEILSRLVLRPVTTESITPAALFRTVELHRPTLLIDEVDTFVAGNDELRGLLNASHRHDGAVLRTVGDDYEPRLFRVYCATALSGIGSLAATLADRSIEVSLQRKLGSEQVKQLRAGRAEHLDAIRSRIVRFIADNADRIGEQDPAMPPGVYNRAADNWLPLLAIADVAGGEWPERARAAAIQAVAGAAADEGSYIELLLGDIRDIFAASKAKQITSADLIERLVEIVPRPWVEYGKSGKPISQNKLARLLKPLGIAPEQIRTSDRAGVRGYQLHQFEEAFGRFLPQTGVSNRYTATNPASMGISDISKPLQPESGVAVEKCEKSNNDGLCSGVAVAKGGVEKAPPLSGNGGDEAGLSLRDLEAVAMAHTERADAIREGLHIDEAAFAKLNAALRRQLADMGVQPEHIELEFERVMAMVFGKLKKSH